MNAMQVFSDLENRFKNDSPGGRLQVPKYLYKYRFLDANQYHIRILTDNELFFPSPENLNDPFDSVLPLRWEEGTRADILQMHIEGFTRANPSLRRSEIRKMAKDLYKTMQHKEPAFIAQQRTRIRNSIFRTFGIYSLSADYRNLLMWSHYSDSHRGFCVGLGGHELIQFFVFFHLQTSEKVLMYKVGYAAKPSDANPYRLISGQRFQNTLLQKALDWEYETEYRLISGKSALAIKY